MNRLKHKERERDAHLDTNALHSSTIENNNNVLIQLGHRFRFSQPSLVFVVRVRALLFNFSSETLSSSKTRDYREDVSSTLLIMPVMKD